MNTRFGFLIFNGVEELDLAGPWEMIGVWSKQFNGPKEIIAIAEQDGFITGAHGLTIKADVTCAACPPLDYLLVPGGMGTRTEVNNPILINFIKSQATYCRYIASVCTGAFLLQAAGLLAGHKATTHWQSLNRLKKFTDVNVQEKRYIKDGNIWTSAGISAGIDMSLALIADIADSETAGNVQFQTEYFPDHKQYISLQAVNEAPAYLKNS